MIEPVRKPTRVLIVGSLNVDLVVHCSHLPEPGETVQGQDLQIHLGGKGANQAVAARRCGAEVAMIGRVGSDENGRRCRQGLIQEGIDRQAVLERDGAATGTALILVDEHGQNSICVSPGANSTLTPKNIADHGARLQDWADVVLLQLEIPLPTAVAVVEAARRSGVPVILNPAPMPAQLPNELLAADILIVNEIEAVQLLGSSDRSVVDLSAQARAIRVHQKQVVVLTRGERETVYVSDCAEGAVRSFEIDCVGTTGAGDAFCGAFAVRYLEVGDVARGGTLFSRCRGAGLQSIRSSGGDADTC